MKPTLRKTGISEGVIIPNEQLSGLKLNEGDSLSIVETPNGIQLVRAEPDFDLHMEHARSTMKKYNIALSQLAK